MVYLRMRNCVPNVTDVRRQLDSEGGIIYATHFVDLMAIKIDSKKGMRWRRKEAQTDRSIDRMGMERRISLYHVD